LSGPRAGFDIRQEGLEETSCEQEGGLLAEAESAKSLAGDIWEVDREEEVYILTFGPECLFKGVLGLKEY